MADRLRRIRAGEPGFTEGHEDGTKDGRLQNDPNEIGCTLAMSDEETELLEAAVVHAVTRHHEADSAELRTWVQSAMVDQLN